MSALTPENQAETRRLLGLIPKDVVDILGRAGVKVVAYPKTLRGEKGRLDYGGLYDPRKREVELMDGLRHNVRTGKDL